MNNKLIEKIKKMFALANCEGAAPGEADNAMRMANKLMEKHNLSSIDLHTKEELTIKFEDGTSSKWIQQLYHSVSKVYSCGFFVNGKENCLIVGTESDTITASIVIHGLIDSINRAGKGKGIAFKNGASLELVRQCDQIIRERNNSVEKVVGTGLILADVYDAKYNRVKDYMNKNLNLTTKASSMKTNEEGKAYGASLNPHARMSNRKALN